jgi:hypothetical protein
MVNKNTIITLKYFFNDKNITINSKIKSKKNEKNLKFKI